MRKGRRKTAVITNVERYVIAPISSLPFAIGEGEGWGGVLLTRKAPLPTSSCATPKGEEEKQSAIPNACAAGGGTCFCYVTHDS